MSEASQRRKTLIRNAAIPNVTIDTGSAISCIIGFIKVLIIPITIAATTAVQKLARENPGTRYSTTKSANTLIARRTINFID